MPFHPAELFPFFNIHVQHAQLAAQILPTLRNAGMYYIYTHVAVLPLYYSCLHNMDSAHAFLVANDTKIVLCGADSHLFDSKASTHAKHPGIRHLVTYSALSMLVIGLQTCLQIRHSGWTCQVPCTAQQRQR